MYAPRLMPFQTEGVEKTIHFLKNNPENACFNASQMGLGKSAMALNAVSKMSLYPALIITPAVTKLNWRDEILKWLSHTSNACIQILDTAKDAKQLDLPTPFTILSYTLAANPKVWAALVSCKFRVLILDECHMVKSLTALRTRAVLNKIWPKIPYRLCLSGTPFTKSIMDAYPVFHRMNPRAFPDWFAFARRYVYETHTPWGIKYHGLKNADELRKIIRDSFFFRYMKADVLPQLPPVRWDRVTLPATFKQDPHDPHAHAHALFIAELKKHYANPHLYPYPKAPESLASYRRLQAMKKLPPIVEFLENLLAQEIPTVFFGYHTEFIRGVASKLSTYRPSFVDGSVSQAARHAEIARFQNGDTNLFIGQYTAAGVGINLTRASTCVLGELTYSPSDLGQAVDRLARIGQKNSVDIYYFIVDTSLDDDIADIVIEKAKTFKQILN